MSILIAASGSGGGKTSVSLALAAALQEEGRSVTAFKAGPDFLDPMHLSSVSARPCYNLDTWMCSTDHIRELVGRSNGIALIEGVMGYYDGGGTSGMQGSSAELAQVLDCAVILLLPSSGKALSFAAIVSGFYHFNPAGRFIVGVIANGCNSKSHANLLQKYLDHAHLPPLLGAVPRDAMPRLESRHLGLIPEGEQKSSRLFGEFGRAGRDFFDLKRIVSLDTGGTSFSGKRVRRKEKKAVIAMARDAAFNFYYRANLDILEECGVRIVPFSPLQGDRLPSGVDGLYLGGGYPELWAPRLQENVKLIEDVRQFARSGGEVYAECGGMIYLGEKLRDLHGKEYPLCAVLPLQFSMLPGRQSLGYREVELARECLLGQKGHALRGHEFHYSRIDFCGTALKNIYHGRNSRGEQVDVCGYLQDNVLASYVHLYFGNCRETAEHIVSYLGN